MSPREETMDAVTRRVSEMYDQFPYPSPEKGKKKLKELSNLLTIFSRETGYDFRGKRILDAGTGTGHRLLEAASVLRETTFVAVDISDRPLAVARDTAREEGIANVEFRRCDLMDGSTDLGRFDVILCMGVLHHLADPRRGLQLLVRRLADDGLIFLYVYGEPGSRERMRRKKIISLLLGGQDGDYEHGIRMVRDLGFDSLSYGWNLNLTDEKTRESLYVDSYLNVHERLFDAASIVDLVEASGLHGFMTYGITVEQSGYLFETRIDASPEIVLQRTELLRKLPTPLLAQAYDRLSLKEKYLLIDLLYMPNGYTLLGFRRGAEKFFKPDGRIIGNAIRNSSHTAPSTA